MKITIDQLKADFAQYAEKHGLKVEVLTPPGPHYASIEEAIASGDPRFGVVPLLPHRN